MSSAQRKCSEMLLQVSAALEQAGIRWCIPSGYSTYPDSVEPSGVCDVDMLVEPKGFLEVAKIIANLSEGNFVQSWRHDAIGIVSHNIRGLRFRS